MVSSDGDRIAAALSAYEIGGELGRGGWGVVIAGKHRQLGREVAIKQLPPWLAADEGIRSRFLTEARLLARMDHPHIVPVYDFVDHDGLCVLVMEKLPGGTLWSEFSSAGLQPERACALTIATCAGLQSAHQQGILHRDIKPENVMFSAAGVPKLTDFGIAKVLGGGKTLGTSSGEVMGTAAYMAPEQATGVDLGPATDVYATGTMLYEFLSGQLPYPGTNDALALLYRHIHEDAVPLTDVAPTVHPAIAEVVMRALSRDLAIRHASAEALATDLAEACTAAWGPGWMSARSGVSVLGAANVVAITERPTDRLVAGGPAAATLPQSGTAPATMAPGSAAPATMAPGTVGPAAGPGTAPGTLPPTIRPGDLSAGDAPPAWPPLAWAGADTTPPATPPPAPPAPPTAPVRPATTRHESVRPVDVAAEDLVPIEDVLNPGPSPWPFVGAALLFAAAAIICAIVGLASLSHSGAGTGVRVAGADPGAHTLTLDLSHPVPITIPGGGGTAKLTVGNIPVVSATVSKRGTADLSVGRYLVAGKATLKLTSRGGGQSFQFPVRSAQNHWVTAPAVVALLATLFVLAYVESLNRALRQRRRRPTAFAGLTIIGAIGGVVAVLDVWVTRGTEPTVPTLVVAGVLGAVAGLASGLGARRAGHRNRIKRRAARTGKKVGT